MKLGTILYTWLKGEIVGTDEFGNRYYRSKDTLNGRQRRWVIYNGADDASKTPSEWHAWLHHTVEEPLTESAAQPNPWQQGHESNKTGTSGSYLPEGHPFRGGNRATATGDYEAWSPE